MQAATLLATIGDTAPIRVNRWARWAVAIAMAATVSAAQGQVYKCTDDSGKTTYADAPCDSASKPLKLQDPTKASTTHPSVCTQLQDETHRLAAEARRNAERGRKESTADAARRQALDKQYAARCMGISRAGAKAG